MIFDLEKLSPYQRLLKWQTTTTACAIFVWNRTPKKPCSIVVMFSVLIVSKSGANTANRKSDVQPAIIRFNSKTSSTRICLFSATGNVFYIFCFPSFYLPSCPIYQVWCNLFLAAYHASNYFAIWIILLKLKNGSCIFFSLFAIWGFSYHSGLFYANYAMNFANYATVVSYVLFTTAGFCFVSTMNSQSTTIQHRED